MKILFTNGIPLPFILRYVQNKKDGANDTWVVGLGYAEIDASYEGRRDILENVRSLATGMWSLYGISVLLTYVILPANYTTLYYTLLIGWVVCIFLSLFWSQYRIDMCIHGYVVQNRILPIDKDKLYTIAQAIADSEFRRVSTRRVLERLRMAISEDELKRSNNLSRR